MRKWDVNLTENIRLALSVVSEGAWDKRTMLESKYMYTYIPRVWNGAAGLKCWAILGQRSHLASFRNV
jgi:hypothetical protein